MNRYGFYDRFVNKDSATYSYKRYDSRDAFLERYYILYPDTYLDPEDYYDRGYLDAIEECLPVYVLYRVIVSVYYGEEKDIQFMHIKDGIMYIAEYLSEIDRGVLFIPFIWN
ncbi:MAG: hypothetical protein LBU03_02970 [Tannerellaceae bacterium]|jgi:hypothetical protein|nr:hypothetical protein [Tannerellaceae bacterium]